MIPTDGLDAVEAACSEALMEEAPAAAVVLNILAEQTLDVASLKETLGMGVGEHHAFERDCGRFWCPVRGAVPWTGT